MLPSQIKRDRVYDREFFPPTSTDATPYQDATKRNNDLLKITKNELTLIFSYLDEQNSNLVDVIRSLGIRHVGGPKNQEYIIIDKHVFLQLLQQKYDKAKRFTYYAKLKEASEYNKLDPEWISKIGICKRKYDSLSMEEQKRIMERQMKMDRIRNGYEKKLQIALLKYGKRITHKKAAQLASKVAKTWKITNNFSIDCDELAKELLDENK